MKRQLLVVPDVAAAAARVALFLVSGSTKREATGRLLRGEDIPAAKVEAQEVAIIADEAAAPAAGGAG